MRLKSFAVDCNGDARGLRHIDIVLHIPLWLIKPIVFFVLLYRRLRYGYAFRKIRLTQGKFAIVDPDDYQRLSKHKWQYNPKQKHNGYAQRAKQVCGKGKTVGMHREVIKVDYSMVVDHINGNGLDNRKANLRGATIMQNCWNRRTRRGSNHFKGVTWGKEAKKWRVIVTCAGKQIQLGFFEDEIEAAKAHDLAAKKYHGEFAVLNFPAYGGGTKVFSRKGSFQAVR